MSLRLIFGVGGVSLLFGKSFEIVNDVQIMKQAQQTGCKFLRLSILLNTSSVCMAYFIADANATPSSDSSILSHICALRCRSLSKCISASFGTRASLSLSLVLGHGSEAGDDAPEQDHVRFGYPLQGKLLE